MQPNAAICLSALLIISICSGTTRSAFAQKDSREDAKPRTTNKTAFELELEFRIKSSAEPKEDKAKAGKKTQPIKNPATTASSPVEDTDPPEVLNDATVAFDASIPILATPAMRRAVLYEYTIFSNDAVSSRDAISSAKAMSPKRASSGPFALVTIDAPSTVLDPLPVANQRACHPRRIGFYAIKYRSTKPTDEERLTAAWYGARAVQTQLVSLDDPGLGFQIKVKDEERVVIGICSFSDAGENPYFGWISLERKKNFAKEPRGWLAYASGPTDEIEFSTIDDLTESDFVLEALRPLDPAKRPDLSPLPFNLKPRAAPRYGPVSIPTPDGIAPIVRVIPSASSLSFSIEFPDQDPPISFHLAGDYRVITTQRDAERVIEQNQQLGTVIVRGSYDQVEKMTDRATAYGADVLRRRRETLGEPTLMGTERVCEDRHLVLFTRDTRSGEKNWLAVLSKSNRQGLDYIRGNQSGRSRTLANVLARGTPLPGQAVAIIPGPPRPWLKPFCPTVSSEPVVSLPLFLGGKNGVTMTEIWIAAKPRLEGSSFAGNPPLFFDVQYLFLEPR